MSEQSDAAKASRRKSKSFKKFNLLRSSLRQTNSPTTARSLGTLVDALEEQKRKEKSQHEEQNRRSTAEGKRKSVGAKYTTSEPDLHQISPKSTGATISDTNNKSLMRTKSNPTSSIMKTKPEGNMGEGSTNHDNNLKEVTDENILDALDLIDQCISSSRSTNRKSLDRKTRVGIAKNNGNKVQFTSKNHFENEETFSDKKDSNSKKPDEKLYENLEQSVPIVPRKRDPTSRPFSYATFAKEYRDSIHEDDLNDSDTSSAYRDAGTSDKEILENEIFFDCDENFSLNKKSEETTGQTISGELRRTKSTNCGTSKGVNGLNENQGVETVSEEQATALRNRSKTQGSGIGIKTTLSKGDPRLPSIEKVKIMHKTTPAKSAEFEVIANIFGWEADKSSGHEISGKHTGNKNNYPKVRRKPAVLPVSYLVNKSEKPRVSVPNANSLTDIKMYLKIFNEETTKENFILNQQSENPENEEIEAASIIQLIKYICNSKYMYTKTNPKKDEEILETFFVSYSRYCTMSELLVLLMIRFCSSKQLGEDSLAVGTRSLYVLNFWFQHYSMQFKKNPDAYKKAVTLLQELQDDPLLHVAHVKYIKYILEFAKNSVLDKDPGNIGTEVDSNSDLASSGGEDSGLNSPETIHGNRILHKPKMNKNKNIIKSTKSSGLQPINIHKIRLTSRKAKEHFDFLSLNESEVVGALCMSAQHIYNLITLEELSSLGWTKEESKHKAPHISDLIDHFNLCSIWAGSLILDSDLVEEEIIQTIIKLIQIANKCFEYQNFHNGMAIVLGLQKPQISRLTKTWKKVPSYERRTFQLMEEFTSPLNNFGNMRKCLKGLENDNQVIAIPFIGISLADLVFNAEISDYVGENRLINFNKHLINNRIFHQCMVFQRNEYTFQDSGLSKTIHEYMSQGIDDEQLWQLSLALQPRGMK